MLIGVLGLGLQVLGSPDEGRLLLPHSFFTNPAPKYTSSSSSSSRRRRRRTSSSSSSRRRRRSSRMYPKTPYKSIRPPALMEPCKDPTRRLGCPMPAGTCPARRPSRRARTSKADHTWADLSIVIIINITVSIIINIRIIIITIVISIIGSSITVISLIGVFKWLW